MAGTVRSGTTPTRAGRLRPELRPAKDARRHTRAGQTAGNPGRRGHTHLFFVAILLLTGVCIAGPPLTSIELGGGDTTVEVVRCHFEEGRIVLRIEGELHVLRRGGELEHTGLRLVDVTESGATITIRPVPPDDGLRLFRITDTGSGGLSLRELATDPEGLSPAPREAPAVSIARNEPSQRGSGED